MEKRDHHYVPRFYLNYFTDPQTPALQKPYVWILDKEKETVKNKAPENFAFEKGYNDITDLEGKLLGCVEDEFGEFEYKASRVFRNIVKMKYISKSERLIMSKFIFSMIFRVPKFRYAFKEIIENKLYKNFENAEFFDDNKSSEFMMDSVIRTTNLVGDWLLRMDWSLLIAPAEYNFITSDSPVVVRNTDDPSWLFCGFASSPKIQVHFPLSQKICLYGTWGRFRKVIEYIDEPQVKELNFETFKYSFKYLYSSSKYISEEIMWVNSLVNKKLIK